VSGKGRKAAPAMFVSTLKSWGRYAPLSRHKAAPTREACNLENFARRKMY